MVITFTGLTKMKIFKKVVYNSEKERLKLFLVYLLEFLDFIVFLVTFTRYKTTLKTWLLFSDFLEKD